MQSKSLIPVYITLILSAFCLSFTLRESKQKALIQNLDTRYYYPKKLGLQVLDARITWEKHDISSAFETYKKNPSVKFHWDNKTQKPFISLTGENYNLPKKNQSELESFFSRYREMIIPKTLQDQFGHLPSRIIGTNKKNIELQFQDTKNNSIQFNLLINRKKGWIDQLKVLQYTEPHTVLSFFTYIQKEKKWLVSQSRASYRISEDFFQETTRYFYSKIKSFWLTQKIKQTILKNGKGFQKFSLRVDQYQIVDGS